jgi:hypothetical protein
MGIIDKLNLPDLMAHAEEVLDELIATSRAGNPAAFANAATKLDNNMRAAVLGLAIQRLARSDG